MFVYQYELSKAAEVLVKRLMGITPGEIVVITADTGSDSQTVDATAGAAYACGAKPMVVYHICPGTMGKSGDAILPVEGLSAVLKVADVWIEFDSSGLMYTTPYDEAMKENRSLRHICMGTADTDMMVRCVGKVDFDAMADFESELAVMIENGKHITMTSPAGTDVKFAQDRTHPLGRGARLLFEGTPSPGSYTLPGAIAWAPNMKTINGTIVFDGGVGVPAIKLGVLRNPIVLHVTEGVITSFSGGSEAKQLEAYLKSFKHPQTLRLAHTGVGFNPGSITRCRFGNMLEDERIWGSVHWGIGEIPAKLMPQKPVLAPMHCDGSCLSSSVIIDNELIVDEGQFIAKSLVGLANELQMVIG